MRLNSRHHRPSSNGPMGSCARESLQRLHPSLQFLHTFPDESAKLNTKQQYHQINLFGNEDYPRQCALHNRCWRLATPSFQEALFLLLVELTAFSNPNMDVATYSKTPARLCDYAQARAGDNIQSFKHKDRLGCSLKAPICLAVEYRIDESSQAPCGIASVAIKHQGN
jgi:hypothetical protein